MDSRVCSYTLGLTIGVAMETDGDFRKLFPHPKTGEKHRAVWRDKKGVLHYAVGAQMISANPDTFIMWAACKGKDVPANQAWLQMTSDVVTCEGCLDGN